MVAAIAAKKRRKKVWEQKINRAFCQFFSDKRPAHKEGTYHTHARNHTQKVRHREAVSLQIRRQIERMCSILLYNFYKPVLKFCCWIFSFSLSFRTMMIKPHEALFSTRIDRQISSRNKLVINLNSNREKKKYLEKKSFVNAICMDLAEFIFIQNWKLIIVRTRNRNISIIKFYSKMSLEIYARPQFSRLNWIRCNRINK